MTDQSLSVAVNGSLSGKQRKGCHLGTQYSNAFQDFLTRDFQAAPQ
jgi:hypothetical protein